MHNERNISKVLIPNIAINKNVFFFKFHNMYNIIIQGNILIEFTFSCDVLMRISLNKIKYSKMSFQHIQTFLFNWCLLVGLFLGFFRNLN